MSLREALEKVLATTDGWTVSNETLLGLLAAHPVEPARPRLDREQIRKALIGKPIIRSADKPEDWRGGLSPEEIGHIANALLNGSGVDSSLHTCPGCGVKVIGHERCGDPTRPECATEDSR